MIEDYHPTGREREVLKVIKNQEKITKQEVNAVVGCNEYILEKTLENLCTAGCVTETNNGTYYFNHDPIDKLL